MPIINSNNPEAQISHSPLPPPIFIRNVNDFIEVRNHLIKSIGSQNFSFKSSANNLKISTTNSDSYREVVKYLKQGKAEYHTYQAREDKAFRIVIRNLHPTTPTSEVGVAIEELGYSVRQVTNIIHKTTKRPLPIFFVDLEPAQINTEIIKQTSLLHTKITVEEPHKKKKSFNAPTVRSTDTPKVIVLILLDVFAAPISTLPNSALNQKILLLPVPCVEITQRITAAVQSTRAYNVSI